MDILKEEKGGKESSKKVSGLIFFLACLVMAFLDQLTEYKLNSMVWTTLFTGGMILIGAKIAKDIIQKK